MDEGRRFAHQVAGVGLVVAGHCEVAAADRLATARRVTADRWLEEVLYAPAAGRGMAPPATTTPRRVRRLTSER